MSIVCLCNGMNSEVCSDNRSDSRSDFHRFLDNLGVEKFVDYFIRRENHCVQIEDYLNHRSSQFLNEIIEEARLRCVYNRDLYPRLKTGVLGRFL